MNDDYMQTVDQALASVSRQQFLPADQRQAASLDRPLPIGHQQTNSQPLTVRRMLQWLKVEPGDKVLDVGSGSGWTTALLSWLVGDHGRVVAVERIPQLLEFGRQNCQRLGLENVEFHLARPDQLGWPEAAKYQRILVSAAATALPEQLVDQLAVGGRLVVPVGGDILEVSKQADGLLDINRHSGYSFVPLL